MKNILFIFFLMAYQMTTACFCDLNGIGKEYILSDFVGIVKITQATDIDSRSYKIEFEIEMLFKGDSITEATVFSPSKGSGFNTDCDIYVEEGQRWLIFASNNDKQFGFGFCSMSNKIDHFGNSQLAQLNNENSMISETVFSETELDIEPILDSINRKQLSIGFESTTNETGIVFVQLEIAYDGQITGASIIESKSSNDKLHEQALEIAKSLNRCIPGQTNGYLVNSRYTIPIKFN